MMYWMVGLSTIGNISFGIAFVAGRKRVPRPAAGIIAFFTFDIIESLRVDKIKKIEKGSRAKDVSVFLSFQFALVFWA